MNTVFNFKRFGYVLKKALFERPIQLFGLTLVMMGLVFLIYSTGRDTMGYMTTQAITFFIGLVGGGYFLSSAVFGQFNSYPRGASFLTLPASNFEKWLAGIVLVLFLYVPIFLLFYRLMDSTLVEVYKNNLDPKTYNYSELLEKAKVFEYNSDNLRMFFKLFLNISAIMLIGSLYFNKMGIIKVAILVCALVFILLGINYLIANTFFQEEISTFPFYFLAVKSEETRWNIDLPQSASMVIDGFFLYVLPSILFLISYIRFKEKEF